MLYLQWQTNIVSRTYAYYDLSNGAVFSDLERLLPPISRSHHYLTLIISETVRDTDTVSTEYLYGLTRALLNSVISNDLEWSWVT